MTHNLVINNGRKPGDMYGKYTSIQWNGSSVVDYVLSSYELFEDIPTLRVGKYIPWISDHCALHFSLSSNIESSSNIGMQPKQFFWGTDSYKKFTDSLSMIMVTNSTK